MTNNKKAPVTPAEVEAAALEDFNAAGGGVLDIEDDEQEVLASPLHLPGKSTMPKENPYNGFTDPEKAELCAHLLEIVGAKDVFENLSFLSMSRNVPVASLLRDNLNACFEGGTFDAREADKLKGAKRTGNDEVHNKPDNMMLQAVVGAGNYHRLVDQGRAVKASNVAAFAAGLKSVLQAGDL